MYVRNAYTDIRICLFVVYDQVVYVGMWLCL